MDKVKKAVRLSTDLEMAEADLKMAISPNFIITASGSEDGEMPNGQVKRFFSASLVRSAVVEALTRYRDGVLKQIEAL